MTNYAVINEYDRLVVYLNECTTQLNNAQSRSTQINDPDCDSNKFSDIKSDIQECLRIISVNIGYMQTSLNVIETEIADSTGK